VSAERLIALETAVAELATLYTVARGFAALRAAADATLLPKLISLGSHLRGLLRASRLNEEEVEHAARSIVALRSEWRRQLEALRAGAPYQNARAALAGNRQQELAGLIPHVLAGLSALRPAPDLYFPVSPSSAHRRPGSSPFLNVGACADKILQLLADGITPDAGDTEWWERDWPSISGATGPAALDTPISLRLAAGDIDVAVFAVLDTPAVRIFAPRLRAPMSITLAEVATDEWWEAYEDSYPVFRDALARELEARAATVSIGEVESGGDR
jgi:hypothetical protein